MGQTALKILLPVIVLLGGAGAAAAMYLLRAKVEKQTPETLPPLIRVVTAKKEDVTLKVRAQGTVLPRTETTLLPQVAGRVLSVSPSFEQGGFFEPDEILVTIDDTDYKLARAQADAHVAQARHRLLREEAESELARKEWEAYGEGEPDPLVLRKPQLEEARAALASAQAALEMARLNLTRTRITAPFAGRVRSKMVDVGQTVAPGTPLARIYAVDYAEVSLPIVLEDLEYLRLPLGYRGEGNPERGPEVVLRTRLGGAEHAWKGNVVRTGAEIDPKTRMLHAVVRVEDPYARGTSAKRPPFMVGLFVNAEIEGRSVRGIIRLERGAVLEGNRILIVDEDNCLTFREIEVLRFEGETAIIRAGLEEGERICISQLEVATEGMKVRVYTGGGK